jgi:hypothetical protein
VRAHAAPCPALAERGEAPEAEDHDARPAGSHPERARRAGVLEPAAGVPAAGHRGDVFSLADSVRAGRGHLPRDRPSSGRAELGLRGREFHPTARRHHGKSRDTVCVTTLLDELGERLRAAKEGGDELLTQVHNESGDLCVVVWHVEVIDNLLQSLVDVKEQKKNREQLAVCGALHAAVQLCELWSERVVKELELEGLARFVYECPDIVTVEWTL